MVDCKENLKFDLGVKGLNLWHITYCSKYMWHINFLKFVCETGSRQPVCFAYLLEKIVERDRVDVKITIGLTDKQ